jgi:hypothetical protein
MGGRSALQQEVISALIDSKAVNFEAAGSVLSQFGERSARGGDELSFAIRWWVIDWCIPPEPWLRALRLREILGEADLREVGQLKG